MTFNLRILKSSSFRLAALYVLLFALSVGGLLTFIYWSTAGYMLRQTDATIEAEVAGLAERYRLDGLEGLVGSLRERVRRKGNTFYLLTDRRQQPLMGNLERWPETAIDAQGWLNFPLEQLNGEVHRARARPFVLRGGSQLLVGRDMHELDEIKALITRAISWGVAFGVLAAALGGFALSRSTARRIEAINETSHRIMNGDLSQRVPNRNTGDDFDKLSESLNHMLDRIQTLMEDVRRVSDNIAHDLRTPLCRLRNRLEKLHQLSDEQEYTEAALKEADGLLATFNALLRIARLETGQPRRDFHEVDVTEMMRDVWELYEPIADAKSQDLSLTAEAKAVVSGDRDLLFQAFANLVDNAIKYTPRGGTIEARVEVDRDAVQVEFVDSGPGIPEAEVTNVLKRFYRMEESRSQPGNGLGLSLVHGVAKLHHAELSLVPGDKGLRVTIRVPRGLRRVNPDSNTEPAAKILSPLSGIDEGNGDAPKLPVALGLSRS